MIAGTSEPRRPGLVQAPPSRVWTVAAGTLLTMEGSFAPGHSPLIRQGAVACADGRVVAAGERRRILGGEKPDLELGEAAVLTPGLVNAHCHLGLSHAWKKTTQGKGFTPWLESLIPFLRQPPTPDSLTKAANQLKSCGTTAVADLATPAVTQVSQTLARHSIQGLFMAEILGFPPGRGPHWPEFLSPDSQDPKLFGIFGHALYSTSPEALSHAKTWADAHGMVYGLHLAEPPEEREMAMRGTGSLADFFRRANILPKNFTPPGLSPTAWADHLGLLNPTTLAVHCVDIDDQDLDILTTRKPAICLCPRSNNHIGVGQPPIDAFLETNLNLCLATDGLCSCPDLSLLNELAFTRRTTKLPLRRAVELITINPARALGIEHQHGRITKGAAALFCVLADAGEGETL